MSYQPKFRPKQLLLTAVICFVILAGIAAIHGRKENVAADAAMRYTLVIDPGHGGVDSGALGADGTRESDVNLAIGLKLRALAEFCGQDNALIRQDDSSKCDSERYSEHRDLECRTALVNEAANPIYVSIHQNKFPTGQPSGPQVLYAAGKSSEQLGSITHGNLIRSLCPENRRVAEPASKKLYILSHVSCPAVLVECGFLSNPNDLENLKNPAFQSKLAVILMASVRQYQENTVRI